MKNKKEKQKKKNQSNESDVTIKKFTSITFFFSFCLDDK